MSLAERLRDLREEAGMSKTALARPRYTVSYVSQIESGRRKPSSEAMQFFAAKLGVTQGFLATGVPDDLEEALGYQLEEALRETRASRGAQAQEVLRPVIAQSRQYGLSRLESQALAAQGEALVLEGRLQEAIQSFEDALAGELTQREAGLTVSAVARAYRAVGDLTYATELIETFLGEKERGPLEPAVAAELQAVLVSIYFERGDVLRAERAAKRALLAAAQGAPLEIQANAYWDASRVLAEARKWDEALDLATRARILMEQLDNRRSVARLHNAYAYLCLEAEPPRTEEAAQHLDEAEELLRKAAAPGDLAYVFAEKGRLALLEDRPEEAVTQAERALAEPGIDELESARCLYLKGRALAALDKQDEARVDLRRAAILFGKLGARQQEAGCWREIGELDLGAGDVDAAVKALRAGLEALDPRRSRA